MKINYLKIVPCLSIGLFGCYATLSSCSTTLKYNPALMIDGRSQILVGQQAEYVLSNDKTHGIEKAKWYSSNPKIATIDHNGVLTAKSQGVTTIVAEVPNYTIIQKKVHIYNDPPQSLEIEGPDAINPYEEIQYTAVVSPSTAAQTVTWSVSETFAKITNDGKLTVENSDGVDVHITATSTILAYVYQTIIVHVNKIEPTQITITGKTQVCMDDKPTYEIEAEPEHASKLALWSVSDPSIAYMSWDGQLTPLKPGNIQIQAKSKTKPEVVAEPLNVSIIEGKRPKAIEVIGSHWIPTMEPIQFKVRARPDHASTAVKWTTDNESVTITDDGIVNVENPCTFKVTATSLADETIVSSMDVQAMQRSGLVSCTFSETIGHAFDVYYDKYVPRRNKFTIRFESTRIGDDEESFYTHNQLKKQDLEVVQNNSNIISSCSLANNILTTPELYEDIYINILGAEISDWCTWQELESLSREDELTDDQNLVNQYFQIGDYKKVQYRLRQPDSEADPNPWKEATFRIIGMHQNWHRTRDAEGVGVIKLLPFTFYSETPNYVSRWHHGPESEWIVTIPKWEDHELEARINVIDLIEFFNFFPTPIITTVPPGFEYIEQNDTSCFLLSSYELNYRVWEGPNPEDYYRHKAFPYFNEDKYKSLNSVSKRRAHPTEGEDNGYWLTDWSEDTGTEGRHIWDNCAWSLPNGTAYKMTDTQAYVYDIDEITTLRNLLFAFCI